MRDHNQPGAWPLPALIALAGLLAALYLTWFPFDFSAPAAPTPQALVARFDTNVVSRYTVKDFPRNIALFVPLGFGVAALLIRRAPRPPAPAPQPLSLKGHSLTQNLPLLVEEGGDDDRCGVLMTHLGLPHHNDRAGCAARMFATKEHKEHKNNQLRSFLCSLRSFVAKSWTILALPAPPPNALGTGMPSRGEGLDRSHAADEPPPSRARERGPGGEGYEVPPNTSPAVAASRPPSRPSASFAPFVVPLLAGFLVSLLIEVGQTMLHDRFTAWADLLANTLGALLGALIALRWGRACLDRAEALLARALALLSPIRAFVLLILWVALALPLVSAEQGRAQLTRWEPAAPLALGAAAEGRQPWGGAVGALTLAPQALDQAAIDQILAGADPTALLGEAALSYAPAPDGSYQSPRGPALLPQPAADGIPWWQSAAPPAELSRAVAAGRAFTLVATITPADPARFAPGQILALAETPFHTNLSLGQHGADLVLRLRGGLTPDLRVADALAGTHPRRVVITLAPTAVRVYLDGPTPAAALSYHPALTLFLGRPPVAIEAVVLNRLQAWVYLALFAALIYLPAGLLLYRGARLARTPPTRALIVLPGLLLSALLIEGSVARAGGVGLSVPTLLLGIAMGLAAAGMASRAGATGTMRQTSDATPPRMMRQEPT